MPATNRPRILVTAALPYANGPLHFGHMAGAYLPADIYCRYKRLLGEDELVFICGSDEHGVAIMMKARQEGIPTPVYRDVGSRLARTCQRLTRPLWRNPRPS